MELLCTGRGRAVSPRLRQEIQSSGLDMLHFRGALVIQVQKLNEQLGYTRLEFRKKVWAGNTHFRVISV